MIWAAMSARDEAEVWVSIMALDKTSKSRDQKVTAEIDQSVAERSSEQIVLDTKMHDNP